LPGAAEVSILLLNSAPARRAACCALRIAKKLLPSDEVEQLEALPPEQALATLTKRLQAR
jgi:hypothetical protein